MKDKLSESEESKVEQIQEQIELDQVKVVEDLSKKIDKEVSWKPVTELGRLVASGEISSMDEALASGLPLLEHEIVDTLLPDLETDLLLIGQAKGKFGGGQRRVFRQTQKKTSEGNKPSFAACAVVGNKDGYVGVGLGKSRETVPARDKAFRYAKLNLFKVRRGVGSWEDASSDPHSIPFAVSGKSGSVVVKLMPAPKGAGLVIERECAKILDMAGIQSVRSHSLGHTKTKLNLIYATVDALRNLMQVKVSSVYRETLKICEGKQQ